MNKYDRMREDYKPMTIDLLFLAESPPVPWNGHAPFFYNESEGMSPRDLFQFMMKALYPTQWRKVKKDFLTAFKKKSNYYLIDASRSPINGNKKKRLSEIIEDDEVIRTIKHLAEEGKFKRDQIRLIIIGKGVHDQFYQYLIDNSHIDTSRGQYSMCILNKKPLNFPRGNRATEDFIRKLQTLVTR